MSSIGGTYGLSGSGMDIDAIVKNLMSREQAKADALLQKKTVAEWQKTAYNKVYDDISNFRDTVFNFKLQSTLSPNKVTSSNTSVATVTANSGAADVNHSLVVAQLADGVKLTSSASLSAAGVTVDRTSLASQFGYGTDPATMPAMSITIANGSASATIKVNPTGTLNDFVKQINDAGINVTANYDTTLDRFFLTTNNSGTTADISFAGSNAAGMKFLTDDLNLPASVMATGSNVSSSASIQATVHADPDALLTGLTGSTLKLLDSTTGVSRSIVVEADDTMMSMVKKIYGSDATASFDSVTGQFSITPNQSGKLLVDGTSDQSAKDLFSQLHLPTTFTAGKVATSTSSVNIPLDVDAPLKGQFAEFAEFTASDKFILKIDDGTGTNTFTSVEVNPTTDSLQDMLDKIKAAPNVADASYDSATGKVTLKAPDGKELNFTGSDAAGTSFLANTLKLHQAGQDAVFKLDGVALNQATNSFSISGVTYNLTGVSTDAEMLSPGVMNTNVGQVTNVSVTNDTDAAVASIQSLVDAYNKILAEVNGMVNETRYKDFQPLTDAQKSAMKDADITAWEAKAKSGMLHNDSTLSSLVNSMRSAFSSPVSGGAGTNNSASSIGITTKSYVEGGKLYLDTDKLRTALNTNPNVLNELFGAVGAKITTTKTATDGSTITTTTTDSKTQGISGRLYDGIKTTMDQLNEIASTTANAQYDTNSNYAKRIKDYDKMISTAADRFDVVQAAYYKKYNAMEVALEQMNSQSTWLSSMLTSSSS
ncbi:MAG TPA: flagellar filament capping protein FliD [Desulfosporosinus sp.]|nr:flagellar filament capping protein FliD [Desulfosporosinus sp.]